ncbi:hypothetical protein C8F04DRAFT_598139 [Mycena alexandri]|uniref:Uncharacterized protein n=1 Tax=Mycena alexandri TaxID=1745969 RepID=A0AAD6XE02_9AGAR|nr:hypothetical protein C8F04DRAFT_598139 [Mycena alexandri]
MSSQLDFTPHVDVQLVNVFLGLQLSGGVGFTLIVLTALCSRHVKRNSTWYTFCLAWIISCVSYTFIFIVGQQNAPHFGACVTQAAGIYSAPALTSCGTLAFAIDMLMGVRAASTKIPPKRRQTITLALLTVPFIIWVILFVGFLVFGINNPAEVVKGPNGTYCDLTSFTPSKISGLVAVAATLLILIIEGYIGLRLLRNRKLLQDRQLKTMAIRVMVFSLLGALGLGVGIAYVLFSKQGPAFDIIMAFRTIYFSYKTQFTDVRYAVPACGVSIFGSHSDLINVWMFWRPRPAAREEDVKSPSISMPTPIVNIGPNVLPPTSTFVASPPRILNIRTSV